MRLGPSTTLVLDSGSRVRDYKCIRSSIWETLAKSGRLTHPQVTNHSLNFSNFSPTAHVATVFPAAVFQILSCTLGCATQLASESETSLWISLDRLDEGLLGIGVGTDFSFDAVWFLLLALHCGFNKKVVPFGWPFNLPLTGAVPKNPRNFNSVSFLLGLEPHP